MPYRRRQDGINALQRQEENKLWSTVGNVAAAAAALPDTYCCFFPI